MASVMSQLGGFQVLLVVVISISSLFFFYLSPIAAASASASRNRRNIIKPIQYYNQSSSSSSSNYHLHYHNGTLLTARITINLLWYGKFNPSQRAIISDFITSLSSSSSDVSTWYWNAIARYYRFPGAPTPAPLSLQLGRQLLDHNYSLGKSLSQNQIVQIAARPRRRGIDSNAVNVVLTADDVAVHGFCQSKCGNHGYYYYYYSSSSTTSSTAAGNNKKKLAYIWIGNSEAQCPGYCAWPIYGPQNKSLTIISPNNDMGLDGMVANFAGLLASTVTNPFGDGYYYHHHHGGGGDGDADAPLEAASACRGMYAGDLLVDPITGASYNANGAHGRRYLVPAIYDPITSTCSTLI